MKKSIISRIFVFILFLCLLASLTACSPDSKLDSFEDNVKYFERRSNSK